MIEKIKANFGIGPMSTETIEAVYRYSNFHRKQIMLIASKNQIDYSGGYVNQWTTSQYSDQLTELKKKYSFSDVVNCRDHCGPGFNGNYDLKDTYDTIKSDIENNFDLIHIDFCHFKGTNEERLKESKKAFEMCKSLNDKIFIEIGTDENLGAQFALNSLEDIEKEIDYFSTFSKPEFFVVQTGSLVMEINQVGSFNTDFSKEISEIIKAKGIKFKEHNADYLTTTEIAKRRGIVDAMNIAPQFGVIQTSLVLNKCLMYGISYDDWANLVIENNKWKKWLYKNSKENKFLCTNIAGHYHFSCDEYKKIIDQLNKHEDITETIIESLMEVIEHYENSFKTLG
jgi:hypothetical protein